jgi:MFS transporter, DHA2 family, multidrug resistance protein
MELKDLFYKWVPVYIKLPVLFILLFSILVANGVFLGNTNEMFSTLGEYIEPYTLAYNAMYIGMGLGLLIGIRMKQRFSNKSLLLYGLCCILLMNIICATTSNPSVVVGACLFLGFAKIAALIEVYLIWLFIWSKKLDSSRLYPFVYFTALTGLYLTTWLTTKLAYLYNWRYAYICVVVLVLFCILLTLIFIENNPLKRVLSFYQMDWPGIILLATIMMLIDYIVVYGKVEDWFNSTKIKTACFALILSVLIFIKRELTLKRPVYNLRIFNRSNFRIGLLYFFLMGIFVPSTFQSAFTTGILHYEMVRNTELNLYMIPGIFVGAVMCYAWYYKQLNPVILIFLGFLGFIIYHIILYQSLALDFAKQDFWMPSLIKGFSLAVFYISVGLYATKNFEINLVMTASGTVILVRSFLGGGIFSSLYNYFLYEQRIKHFNYLAGKIDKNDFIVTQQGTALEYYKNIQQQAVLTASKELTGYIIIAGFVVLAGILINAGYLQLKNRLIL